MSIDDAGGSEHSSELAIVLELSRRIRAAMAASILIAALLLSVLYVHKPTVRESDLTSILYSLQFAEQLQASCGESIEDLFVRHGNALDYPWNEIGRQYLRADGDRAGYLESYLNTNQPERSRQLLALIESSPGVRREVMQYIETTKGRWQSFMLPFLDIEVSRDEVAFYLGVTFVLFHSLALLKWHYLLRLRASRQSLDYIPDPSLLTAAFRDLDILRSPERLFIGVIQAAFWAGVPLTVGFALSFFFWAEAGANISGYTRLFSAVVLADILAVFVLIYWVVLSIKPAHTSLFRQGQGR